LRNLELAEWASIAEIVASVVVIASLFYVAIELRHNTQALQHASYQNVLDRMSDEQLSLAANEELLDVIMKAEKSPNDLSALEWRRFKHQTLPAIGTWEYLYLANQEGAVSDLQWRAFEPYFLELICAPGYLKLWEDLKYAFSSEFIEYMNSTATNSCDSRRRDAAPEIHRPS
jgi:hypothetical protein